MSNYSPDEPEASMTSSTLIQDQQPRLLILQSKRKLLHDSVCHVYLIL